MTSKMIRRKDVENLVVSISRNIKVENRSKWDEIKEKETGR